MVELRQLPAPDLFPDQCMKSAGLIGLKRQANGASEQAMRSPALWWWPKRSSNVSGLARDRKVIFKRVQQ